MSDPFLIPKEGHSLYFRIQPPVQEWINVFLMKALIEINIMYTVEKQDEYKLRMMANSVLQESTGKFGYYAARSSKIFFGIFNYIVIISLVAVQSIMEPSIIAWVFFALNLINLSYMLRGNYRTSDLRVQYILANIIKIFSLAVIILTIFVLANSHAIDENIKWSNVKRWLQILGLKANVIDLSSNEF